MRLRQRLIFGTARLAGGGCAAASRRLLEDCLTAGIAAFDTAPSYGMGAAEALVGQVAGQVAGVRVHTKLGSVRPGLAGLRGWAKRGRGLLRRSVSGEAPALLVPYAGPSQGCDYSPAAMAASLERSLALLRRERLDLLLLHEAEPADLPAAGRAVLAEAQTDGIADSIGFAHFGPARTNDSALTAQVAPWPEDFSAGPAVGLPRIFHSIRNGGRFAAARDPAWAARQAALAERIVRVTREGDAGFLAALLTLAESWPQAGLIFATTDRARLGGFLRALDAIEGAGLCNAAA